MDKKDKAGIFALVSTCVCAVIWNILVFVDLYYGYTNNVSFTLHLLCAAAWDICAIAWIVKYIKSKRQ